MNRKAIILHRRPDNPKETFLKNTGNRVQRKFVVEYKSNRRRPKTGVKSIWGDTDLKALARAATDDVPFSEMTSNDKGSSNRDTARGGTVPESESHTPALIETDESTRVGYAFDAYPELAIAIETPGVPDLPSQQKRKRLTGSRAKTKPSRLDPSITVLPPGSIATPSDEDILSILEMENKRLKELLVVRLRSENEQLKEMLQRFEP